MILEVPCHGKPHDVLACAAVLLKALVIEPAKIVEILNRAPIALNQAVE
jgi:hypothetical protein